MATAKHTAVQGRNFLGAFRPAEHVEFLAKIKKSCGDVARDCLRIVFRYGLTALYNGGDLQIENVDLALTKDGDLRLSAIPYNAMFRLVQSWRYNAPAMRLMFDTIYKLRSAKPELEQNLEEILSRGPALGRFFPSTDVPLYHAANDAIGATEVSRSALAGSLIIVVGSLLGRFKDDLNVSSADWNAGMPNYAEHSFGRVVTAAANSFRHADEWKKALFAKNTTDQRQRSMDVLKGALGLQAEHVLDNSCEAVLDLIGNQDFDELAKSALTFERSCFTDRGSCSHKRLSRISPILLSRCQGFGSASGAHG